ncbi:hypothetical protein GCM10020000_72090 [Streptomyces olivoverticillatus]
MTGRHAHPRPRRDRLPRPATPSGTCAPSRARRCSPGAAPPAPTCPWTSPPRTPDSSRPGCARPHPTPSSTARGAVGGSALTLTAVNARGPAALCAALHEAAPDARLVHLGSAAEYGPADGHRPAVEDGPARPLGLYGAAKLA